MSFCYESLGPCRYETYVSDSIRVIVLFLFWNQTKKAWRVAIFPSKLFSLTKEIYKHSWSIHLILYSQLGLSETKKIPKTCVSQLLLKMVVLLKDEGRFGVKSAQLENIGSFMWNFQRLKSSELIVTSESFTSIGHAFCCTLVLS
jgi:hypothetical protein